MLFKKLFFSTLISASLLVGCAGPSTTSTQQVQASEVKKPKITYLAELYDNHGSNWLSIEGSQFTIKPNKIKQYGYDTDGDWTYWYETSSIVSIEIDNKYIETCGSTALFYDSRLQKIDIELPKEIQLDTNSSPEIDVPAGYSDYWTVQWWWKTKSLNNKNKGARLVIVQSQEGDPICIFEGNDVSWDIPKKLPKTTEICIDGKMLYIHRANFSIIDTSMFE